MKGRGTFLFKIGSLTVTFQAWVAEVHDPCILGLDFLKFIGCSLNRNGGVLVLPGGECIQLTSPMTQVSQTVPTCGLTASPTINSSLTADTQPGLLDPSPGCLAPPLQQSANDLKDRRDSIKGMW